MNPERWREIEKLYHSAREQGAGILAEDPDIPTLTKAKQEFAALR